MANPAPSTPPTDPNEYLRQMRAKLHAMFGLPRPRPTVEEAIRTIKNTCKLLMSYGILDAAASYDGSGDGGEMNVSVKHEHRVFVGIGHAIPNATDGNTFSPTVWCNIDYFFRNIVKEKDTLITQKTIDDLEEALLELLPEYWNTDDGGFGEIEINIVTGEITVEHNERIVEVRTTTKTY